MTPVPEPVKAWSEPVTFPTYGIGQPDKNPMFLEKRVYQGSSGVVYPYPVIDRVSDERADRTYTGLYIENRYLKVLILPELGGRVHMALDKTQGYHFIYYNRVIKPALVGLTGPWISGGIEFNWPQHHRPSTFDAVDWHITSNPDGSRTIWCAEIERMFFTQGRHAFTLHPDRACLQIDVQLYNRTAEPQTFLWWANPAVSVNDDYQSVFPPDVHAVMDHGKRDVSSFPIATGTYYKVNYAPGTDISRYKNIPVPTSYMAHHSDFDFVGDYDHGRQAGMLHVANHHLVPGKKQWTWGHGEFGQAWDRQLTDEDGPYIELMCGAFTDNQPDFSWLMPGETKRFTQVFLPYRRIGPAKNASAAAVVNLEVDPGEARLGVYVTEPRRTRVELWVSGALHWQRTAELSPEAVLQERVGLPAAGLPATAVGVRVLDDASGQLLVAYTPLPDEQPAIPEPATPARPPAEVASNEELYLNGLHLEQYRHATFAPEPYYLEALRRDPGDARCNNALGLLLYRRGKFAQAEPYFRAAIARLTARNPNPYDGEPHYNLGLCLKMQGREAEAEAAFYKAVWNSAWQAAGYFELARLAARRGDHPGALDLVEDCLRRNGTHQQARQLKIALLRQLGQAPAAQREIEQALQHEPLDYGAWWERRKLSARAVLPGGLRVDAQLGLALAVDYFQAGLYPDAVEVLEETRGRDPLAHYLLAECCARAGQPEAAAGYARQAAALPPDYCFPHRLESVLILEAAQRRDPADPRAPYYLGNFWYAHRRYDEAIACWERARDLDPGFATVHRNLGLAYFNKRGDAAAARSAYERAFQLNQQDARVLFELDQLEKKLNRPPAERLARLERLRPQVDRRDDLTIEYVALLNLAGRPEEALALLRQRRFHPWEGGEGKTTGQYVASLAALARSALARNDPAAATAWLEQAVHFPDNLGEGKLLNAQENHLQYYLGLALEASGRPAEAQARLEMAAIGLSEPASARYYNDQPPDTIFYQGLARRRLGREAEAREIFQKLADYGRSHLDDPVALDYFAVSLPDFLVFDEDLAQRHRVHCLYMWALGCLGLGQVDLARQRFAEVLRLQADHAGAHVHQGWADRPKV